MMTLLYPLRKRPEMRKGFSRFLTDQPDHNRTRPGSRQRTKKEHLAAQGEGVAMAEGEYLCIGLARLDAVLGRVAMRVYGLGSAGRGGSEKPAVIFHSAYASQQLVVGVL